MLRPRSARAEILGASVTGSIVLFFSFILLWHDPQLFWNDDYELSILPVFADVARSWNEGHLPLLSPFSWVCSNLAGEFQYGTFSIFVNVAVFLTWKFPLAFAQQAAALSISHLFVLAVGAFLLGRQRGFGAPLAMMVAFVATLNGWTICWGATDWFGALGAFAWLPWAWWGLERALDRARSRWRFLWPAPFVYLVVTGGFPYTVVMLGVLAAWLSLKSVVETRRFSSLLPLASGLALGFGLSAPAWLALLDYVQGSGRGAQSALAHKQWLVPPGAWPGLILPCWTVKWADFSTRYMPHAAMEMACGLVPPVALIAGLIRARLKFVRQIRWELGLLCFLVLVAMLPSAGVFRWSFRWLPLIHIVLALCAAEALREEGGARRFFTSPGFIGFVVVALTTAAMVVAGLTGEHAFPLAWIILAMAAGWAVAEQLVAAPFRSCIPPIVVLSIFLATYLCIAPNCGVPKYNLAPELTVAAPLDPARLYLSVYPAAEHTYRTDKKEGTVGQIVRPGSTSMWGALRFINGYSPILAGGVAREFEFAIHGEIDPEVGDYLVRDQSGRAGILEQLGVDGLVIAQEIAVDPPSSDWDLAFSGDEGRVFHRRGKPFSSVRSINWIDSLPNEDFATANVTEIADGRNSVNCEVAVPADGRRALLTFSRPYFRGYRAQIDGKLLAVGSYRGLMPTVVIPAGARGHLVLSYRPAWLIYGGAVSILCAIVVVLSAAQAVRSGRTRKVV